MSRYIYILLTLLLFSCKTVDCFQYVETLKLPIDDTLQIPSLHHHYVEDSSFKCVYVKPINIRFHDTLYIEIYEFQKVKPKKCY